MKNEFKYIALFLVFSFLFGGGFQSFFGMIRGNDPVETGQTVEYHVNVINRGQKDIEDVHVRMYILELGEMFVVNTFDVDKMDSSSKFLFWDTENVPPGEYWARFTVSNDDFKKVKYRPIIIS